MLGLQQSVGNRAVQRMVSDARPVSADSRVIQRHLAPGMDAVVFGAAGSLMGNAAVVQSTAAQMLNSAFDVQRALAVSSTHACPQGGAREEPVVSAIGGI